MYTIHLLAKLEALGVEVWPSPPRDICDGRTEDGISRSQEVVLTAPGRGSVKLDLEYRGKPWSIGLMFGEALVFALQSDCWAIMEGVSDPDAKGLISVLGLPLVRELASSLN